MAKKARQRVALGASNKNLDKKSDSMSRKHKQGYRSNRNE